MADPPLVYLFARLDPPRARNLSRTLEGNVVVSAARGLLGEGRRGRHRRPGGRSRPLGAAHELDALRDHLGDRPLLAVLAFPVTRLQPALDEDLTALVEVLTARLRLLAPHDNGEEARLLPPLTALHGVVAVHREAQIGHSGAAGRVPELRRAGQVADQQNLIEARHQTTSCTTSSPFGSAFADRTFLRIGTRVDRKRRTFSLSRSCRSNSFTTADSAETANTA